MSKTEKILDLHAAGHSAAEIVGICAADPRHVRDIMATSSDPAETDLGDLLISEFGVLRQNTSAGWVGSLAEYCDGLDVSDPAKAALKAGIETLFYNLILTNRPVRCATIANIGSLTTAITQIVGQLHGDAAAVSAAMDELTGGRLFAGVDAAEVQTVIDSAERAEAYELVISRHNNGAAAALAAFDAGQTPAEIVAAAESAEA